LCTLTNFVKPARKPTDLREIRSSHGVLAASGRRSGASRCSTPSGTGMPVGAESSQRLLTPERRPARSPAPHVPFVSPDYQRAICSGSFLVVCRSKWGLPSHPSHLGCWWSLTPPFHPYLRPLKVPGTSSVGQRRSVFCGTVPRVTPGGCCPPPCSAESGLSSTSHSRRRRAMDLIIYEGSLLSRRKVGTLILGGASRLDAFSASPVWT
jgi:hypothetical protein